MGIRADHAVARPNQTLFRQKGVLNTHAAHVIKIGDAVFFCKFPCAAALLGGLDILVRREVVHHQRDFILVENRRRPALFKFVDCNGGRDIVAQHEVEPCLDHLPGCHRLQPRVRRENFLRHCHSQFGFLPFCGFIVSLLCHSSCAKNVTSDTMFENKF